MNATKPKSILLVEDDAKLAGLIKAYLERNHFTVAIEHDGDRAVSRVMDENPTLVVLDIMLPGKDGRTICRELRSMYNGPIVMLTALDEEVDQIVGLELGADDYITKPVRPRLLLSRINALLRVVARSGSGALKNTPPSADVGPMEKIVLGKLEIHPPQQKRLSRRKPPGSHLIPVRPALLHGAPCRPNHQSGSAVPTSQRR